MSTTVSLAARESELRGRAAKLAAEIEDLSDRETLTDAQSERLQRQTAAAFNLIDEIDEVRDQRVAQIRQYASNPSHVQSGDGAAYDPKAFNVMTRGGDPWEAEVRGQSAVEFRDRAMYAAERNPHVTDDGHGIVEQLLDAEDDPTNVASRWAIATSRPEYRSAFEKYLKHPVDVAMYLSEQERFAFQQVEEVRAAWAEGSNTTGGFAVPIDYDLSLLLINSGSSNPFRLIADVKQTVGQTYRGLSSAGVTASWNTESTEAADATPTVAGPSWTVQKANAYLQASFEVIQDSDLGSEVAMLLLDAKNNLEADAFATGTGGGQPYGAVTRAASLGALVFGDSGSTVEKEIVISDVYAMSNALPERYQANASWVMNRAIGNSIRRLGETLVGYAGHWTDLGPATPPTLLGYEVYFSSAMDSTVVSGSLDYVALLGDFRQAYRIVDRVGVSVVYNPLVIGSNRRPTGEAGWYAFWRVAGDVTDQTSATGLKVLRK